MDHSGDAGFEAKETADKKGRKADDPDLASTSLPSSTIKRIVRTASPGVRFNSEAIAGFHRVAQAFVLFATDRSIAEVAKEAEKLRKASKSKSIPTARKTLTSEHVMRFLTSEMPPIASKVAALFPDLMPGDFKPAGVRLLEQLQEQSKVGQAGEDGAQASTANGTGGLAAWASTSGKRALDTTPEQAAKRPRRALDPSADLKEGGAAGDLEEAAQKPALAKKVKDSKAAAPVQSMSLSKFFGAPKASVKSGGSLEQKSDLSHLEALQEKALFQPMEEDAQPREIF
jgi:histone H3/H4